MSCNCNSGETPEYYITLNGVGADGYSPEINIVQEDTSSFKLNLINKNNEQITPAIPKLEYLNDTFVTNDALNTTLANYSTTAQIAATYLSKTDAATTYLKVDGTNANNPITINNLSIQSIGTGARVGSSGGTLTLQGSGVRPAYLQTGSSSKSLALLSDVTTKLNADGSNATNPATINGHTFESLYQGYETHLTMSGAPAYIEAPSLILRGTDHNGKVYYGSSGTDTEIATKGDIKNSTITFTQGGVVKGSFTLNQSTDATIALDAGGGSVSGNRIQLITEDGTRGISLGINNTTKEAFMTYDIIGGISFDLNLISGKTAPITLTKNSDGTYGIGLDYDNDTLKVNQNGKLYADIEAPTYTAGTGIDIDNEEISVESDYIEAHKAYLADGDLLTDPQGLEDVKYYNQSSFDRSKFTVVGTPTITDDGIASGLKSGNSSGVRTTINASNLYGHSFKFTSRAIVQKGKNTVFFNFSPVYNDLAPNLHCLPHEFVFDSIKYLKDDDTVVRTWVTSGTTTYNNFFTDNNPHWCTATAEFDANTNIYSATLINEDNNQKLQISKQITDAKNNNASPTYFKDKTNATVYIGNNRWTDETDTIDLKQFSITVDGVPVFSGNKTGIDTIKPDNYTVVGTPTISADGVASGFSNRNYLQAVADTISSTNATITIKATFTISTKSTEANKGLFKLKLNNTETTGIFLFKNASGALQIRQNSAYKLSTSTANYDVNIPFDVVITITNKALKLSLIQNNVIIYNELTGTLDADLSINQIFLCEGGDTNTIDLNAFKIYVDGNLVYQPCLKVPYALSKTGSKIVDSQYRDRVQDAYNDQGYAPYYTLDETNSNFTLPMGEIYGYITRLEGIVKDLQTRLTALESNINGGGAGVVQQGLLGMSPLSLNRPQLLGELNPIDGLDTMDIQPTEDEITPATISEDELEGEITQEELEPQPIEEEVAQEEVQEEPQETENEGGENE